MINNIVDFYDKIETVNNKLSKYSDELGNVAIIPTAQLICGVEYMELSEDKFKIAKFNKIIDDLEYATKKGFVIRDKYEITKNAKDKNVIFENEETVNMVWIVKNGKGNKQSFTTKEEAVELCNNINEAILKELEV